MTSLPNLFDSATTPRLPFELLRPIIESLGGHRATLAALARCNSLIGSEAERALYARLDESSASDTNLHVAFLSSITRNPRLASLVKVYYSINIVHYEEAPLWDLFRQALGCMDNLEVLHFRMFGGQPTAYLLVGAPFQLERLHWANHSEGPGVARVLAEQQRLKYLYLELRQTEDIIIPSTCCPHIKELSGNQAALEALLPGRDIEGVAWVPQFLDASIGNDKGVDHIGTALRNLKTLSFGGFFPRPNFALVVGYLDRLERLELVELLPNETQLLKRLSHLRELVISFNWGTRRLSIPQEQDERQHLVHELFFWTPNLVYVDMAYEWISITNISYQRWTRKTQDSPVVVAMTMVKQGRFAGRDSI